MLDIVFVQSKDPIPTTPTRMRFLLSPPARVRPGAVLSPVVVGLEKSRWTKVCSKDIGSGLLWAFVSVTDEAGKVSLAPPLNDLVAGQLSTTVHTVTNKAGPEDGDEVGFFSFPNLAIKRPGNYRLQVSLMKHDTTGVQGATNLETISSSIIHVASSADPIRLGKSISLPHLL